MKITSEKILDTFKMTKQEVERYMKDFVAGKLLPAIERSNAAEAVFSCRKGIYYLELRADLLADC